MTPRQLAQYRDSANEPFPLRGPPLPPGWLWVIRHVQGEVIRAEHESAPLVVYWRRGPQRWRASVRGAVIRNGGRATIQEFTSPFEAANAALAAFTGAKVAPCT